MSRVLFVGLLVLGMAVSAQAGVDPETGEIGYTWTSSTTRWTNGEYPAIASRIGFGDGKFWYGAQNVANPWIIFEFDDVYKIDAMNIYNFVAQSWMGIGGAIGFENQESWDGIKDVTVWVTTSDVVGASSVWVQVPGITQFDFAGNVVGSGWYVPNGINPIQPFDLNGIEARAIKFEIINSHNGSDGFLKYGVGLNDVKFYGREIETPEPATMSLLALGGLALLRRRK